MKIEVHYPENTLEHDLEEYDLRVWHRPKVELDCEPIDFEILGQKDDTYATVYGSEPFNDVEIECDHDYVEYGEDKDCGVCALCGAKCLWHWETFSDDGNIIKDRVIDGWLKREKNETESIIGKELKRLQENW